MNVSITISTLKMVRGIVRSQGIPAAADKLASLIVDAGMRRPSAITRANQLITILQKEGKL